MKIRRLRLVLSFCAVSSGVGCAGTYRSPASGGNEWYEASSAHFIVRTDVGAEEARQWASEYERIFTFLDEVIFPWPDAPAGVTDVVIFDREAEYKEIAPRFAAGFFDKRGGPGYDPRPLIVAAKSAKMEPLRRTFVHELVHRFVGFHFPGAPIWLNEGLATFYETTRFSGDQVIIGEVPYGMRYVSDGGWHAAVGKQARIVFLSELGPAKTLRQLSPSEFYATTPENKTENEERRQINYIAAWAHAHVLLLGPRDLYSRFNQYLNALSTGKASAWDSSFDAPSSENLEAAYRAFLSRTETSTATLAAPPVHVEEMGARKMAPSEVHEVWAAIRPRDSAAARARARQDIERSIQLAPNSAAGYMLRAEWWQQEGELRAERSDVQLALAREPGNVAVLRYWGMLLLFEEMQKAEQARRWDEAARTFSRLRFGALSSQDWLAVAFYEAFRQRFDRAMRFVTKAARWDSSCWECFWLGGEIEFAKGEFDAALRLLNAAVVLAGKETNPEFRARLDRVERVAERCRQTGEGCGARPLELTMHRPRKR